MVSAVYSARRLRGLALKFFPVSAYRFGNIVDRGSGTRCSFFIFMRSAATVHTWLTQTSHEPDIADFCDAWGTSTWWARLWL